MNVSDIRKYFIEELKNKNFTKDKSGQETIELVGASFIADEQSIFGVPNKQYIDKEIKWYQSGSTNVNDIYGKEFVKAPEAWVGAADKYGNINSNYGKLIFDSEYHNQYNHALGELLNNPDSRRATMVYTRPSIWREFNKGGMSDFICTNAVTYYVRDGKLNAVVQMRSNDVVFGYKNDWAWQMYVLKNMVIDWNKDNFAMLLGSIEIGTITWQVQNLHVYSRHFDLVK